MSTRWNLDRSRAAWWLFGGVLSAVVAFVAWSFVGTFVFGVFIYYATRPLYSRLRRRIRPASLAAVVSLFVLALPAVLLLAYTVAIGLREFNRFASRFDVAGLDAYLDPYLDVSAFLESPQELLVSPDRAALLREALAGATASLGILGTAALHLFVMIAIAFYLLRDDHRLSRWVRRRFADEAGVLEVYIDAVDRSYHQIFFGNILNAVLTASIGAITYNVLNLFAVGGVAIPYPTLLGLLTGIASLVPVVGMKLVYVPTSAYLAGVTLLGGSPRLLWFPAVFFALSFVVVDSIPDFVLRPYVSGRDLHVGMIMFAYIFGPLLFGWYGIFLGPMILVLIVHFAKFVLPELVAGEPLRPVAVDPTYLTGSEEFPAESSDAPDAGDE